MLKSLKEFALDFIMFAESIADDLGLVNTLLGVIILVYLAIFVRIF